MSHKHFLLACDGGGIRGVTSLQVHKFIERTTGKPIAQLFNGIAGVSTGAILAAAFAAPRPLSAAALEQRYTSLCKKVFDSRTLSLGGWLSPQYDAGNLEKALQDVLGDTRLHDARIPLGAGTYNLETRQPELLTSYGAASRSLAMWEAARASSAALTYFDPYKTWVDGGFCCNSPGPWFALDYSFRFGVPLSDIHILVVGTGRSEKPLRNLQGKGKLGCVADIVDICLNASTDLAHAQAQEMGLGSYLVIDIPLPEGLEAMDNVEDANLFRLRQLGNQMVGQQLPALNAFLMTLLGGQSSAPPSTGT